MRTLLAAVAVLLVLVLGMGRQEPASWTGRVSMVGNEPFSYLALTQEDGRQWRLSGPKVKEMSQSAQGLRVRVTGQAVEDHGILVESWTPVPDREQMQ